MKKIAVSAGVVGAMLCMAAGVSLAKPPQKGGGGGGGSHPTFHASGVTHVNVGHTGRTTLSTHITTFAAHRTFAGNAAFHPFFQHGWHPWGHFGWVGPWFWPYGYSSFFFFALWPYAYGSADPFWVYGYNDLYYGIFSPYAYDSYVQGPGAPARMSQLTQSMADSCAQEAAEVAGWPIDQIRQALQPSDQQQALLADLGNAVVQASNAVKSQCATTVAFTPTGRLAAMQQRLQGMLQAVKVVESPLAKFYDSLSDEQKARFDAMGASVGQGSPGGKAPPNPRMANAASAQAPNTGNAQAPNAQTACGGNIMAWPADQIDRVVQPNDVQRAKLDALQIVAGQAADMIKAACPTGATPQTPPGRLEAIGKRLQAMLQAVETVQPALQAFYDSLTDDQKARFNTLGRQLSAATQ